MCTFFVFDLETGGLAPRAGKLRHGITEIAVILLDAQLRELSRYETKVLPEPGDVISASARRINGFDEDIWFDEAIPLSSMMEVVLPMLTNLYPVGHNVNFDLTFLKDACDRLGKKTNWRYHSIDTVSMALPLKLQGIIPSMKLEVISKYLGVPHTNPHRAMSDVEATLGVARILSSAFDFGALEKHRQKGHNGTLGQ